MSRKIIVQLLSRYPITTHTYLVYLHDADWSAFVWSDTAKRIEILKPYLRDIRLGLYAPRELIWIDLESISINDTDKEEIKKILTL